jgi:hypothetical protein
MGEREDCQEVRELLVGLAHADVGALIVDALRRWRRSEPTNLEPQMNDGFGKALAAVFIEKRGQSVTPDRLHRLKEPFLSQQHESWMQPVIDTLGWTVRAGLLFPLYQQAYPVRYRLTAAGAAFLDAADDHPLLHGFVERVAARCPGLPDEVSVHLVDARACLDYGLGRPAVSLMGLAYEAAENEAIVFLERNRGLVLKKDARAAQRIAGVLKLIPELFDGDLDRQGRARAAWDFADQLRDRRNHASHPKAFPDFSDLTEVHEFLVSAGRHLPGLWSVTA